MPLRAFFRFVCVALVCAVTGSGVVGLDAAEDPALRVYLASPRPAGDAARVTVVAVGRDSTPRQWPLDADQPAVHLSLPAPGDYDVTVSLSDGRSATVRIACRAGQTVVLEASFLADAPPTVSRLDDVPDGEGARFDARALRDLPSADNLWSLVETAAPFVVADRLDTGGLGTARTALVGSRGESWALTEVSFGGLPVVAPTTTGALPVLADMNAAEAVTVSSGVASVDVGTPGVNVVWIPRKPGLEWTGGFDASATTPGLVGTNHLPTAPSVAKIEDWRQAGVYAGGPVSDRTGLFVSTAVTRATFFERDAPPLMTSRARSVLGHLVASLSSSDQLSVLASLEGGERPFEGRQQFADTAVVERSTFGRGMVTWDHLAETGGVASVSLGYQRGRWQPRIGADAIGGTMDRVFDGVVPQPAADEIRTQWDVRVDGRTGVRRFLGMIFDGRGGISLRRVSSSRGLVALPVVAESVAGIPARVWLPREPGVRSDRSVTEIGLFANDRYHIGSRFTVDAGARVEIVRGTSGGAADLSWTTFSPRLSFRWSPAAMSFFGSVGRYTGGNALSLLGFGDPGSTTWDVYRWTDPNGDGAYDEAEQGALVRRAGLGPAVASLDPDLRVPRTVEWVAGAEVRPTQYSTLRGSIIIRRQTNLVGVINTGLTAGDYRVFELPDANADEGSPADDQLLPVFDQLPSSFGRDALLLTNPDTDAIAHDGIEVTYEIVSPRWFMLFGATAYRTLGLGGALGHGPLENDPLVLGDRYANPNATKDVTGRLFFDRAYVGKWTTAYRAPGDVRLAAVVRYQDGQPFTRFVVTEGLAGGPEITHAYAMGRTRFTYTATIDARIEKGFTLGGRRRVSVRLDAFNLTNHRNELEEDVLTGPTFRVSTIVQPPRTLRLGMRVEF